MFNKLFSINDYGSRRVINILGLKIKYLNLKPEILANAASANRNIVSMLFAQFDSFSEDDLFCLKSGNILFILHKGCLNLDYAFFQDYVLPSGFDSNRIELIKLDPNSILYKEHISRVSQGEFLWKYVERYYFIAHSFISMDKDGEIYINSSYVKEENQVKSEFKIQHTPLISKRKYMPGITVAQYLEDKSSEEKFVVVDKLLDYIFTTYRDKDDPKKVSGDLFDCHMNNFLIGNDGLFHFIDFDLKCNEALDRAYCVYFMLYKQDINLYKKMLEVYGLEDRHAYYENNFSIYRQPTVQNGKSIITAEHIKLQKKYFGDLGIRPQFELKYEKAGVS